MSTAVHITLHEAQIIFGDLPLYLNFAYSFHFMAKCSTYVYNIYLWVQNSQVYEINIKFCMCSRTFSKEGQSGSADVLAMHISERS
jgi:hypothetical protein